MTHTAAPYLSQVSSITSITWPNDAVIVADQDLPTWVLDALSDPVLVQAGESLKTLGAIETLGQQVLNRRHTRPMTLVAVGGGSIGDAVGFLASILWRGVGLWHVPTTMVAMVDSAHGGKTAVNLGQAKNQLGTFYPASRVILCHDILAAMPLPQRKQGLVELIKALWLGAPDALEALDTPGVETFAFAPFPDVADDLSNLMARAIDVKLDIVQQDPIETLGIRTFLNFGHTFAHALELLVGLDHGSAVAWGMAIAGHLSQHHGTLSQEDYQRLYRHVYPLMAPIHPFERPSHAQLSEVLARDKKRIDGHLRSVVLDGPGRPRVVNIDVPAWLDAWEHVYEHWFNGTVTLRLEQVRPAHLKVTPSKSELNRMLVIQHLRPGITRFQHDSRAADVVLLERGLEAQRKGEPVYVGDGGTTFRFLAALAALTPRPTRFQLSDRLFSRPHQALFDALQAAGAYVTLDPERHEVVVTGTPDFPEVIAVDGSVSSQFASALALLSASGRALTLQLGPNMVSRGYFEMTCDLLEQAGVDVHDTPNGLVFHPLRVHEALVLNAEPDASSNVVWEMLRWLGFPVSCTPASPRQPDSAVFERISANNQSPALLDVQDMPDVVPVVCAALAVAAQTGQVIGGEHLKAKESNRIDDVVVLLRSCGVDAEALENGIELRGGTIHSATLNPGHDHRLAFAALVLASARPQRLQRPWVVLKSYPEFYDHARQAGWSILPGKPEHA